MANDAAEAAAIYTIDKYIKGVEDQITTELPEVHYFKEHVDAFSFGQHGPGVRWNARLDRNEAEGFARETRLTVTRKNRAKQATLNNRGYGLGEMIHITDIWENGAPEKLADLLTDMLDAMTSDMFVAVNSGFYDDGTDETYDGLGFEGANSFLITSGSYAGIAIADAPSWSSSSVLTDTAPYNRFTEEPQIVMQAMITHVRSQGGAKNGKVSQKPDVAFLHWDKFNITKATLERRYNYTLPQNKKLQELGGDIEHFVYGGVTWIPSFECPTDYVYMFTSDTIRWEFPSPKFINEYRQEEGIPRAIYALYIIYGRIRCTAPRNNGRFLIA